MHKGIFVHTITLQWDYLTYYYLTLLTYLPCGTIGLWLYAYLPYLPYLTLHTYLPYGIRMHTYHTYIPHHTYGIVHAHILELPVTTLPTGSLKKPAPPAPSLRSAVTNCV